MGRGGPPASRRHWEVGGRFGGLLWWNAETRGSVSGIMGVREDQSIGSECEIRAVREVNVNDRMVWKN